MCRQVEEHRLDLRFPFSAAVSYTALGDEVQLPQETAEAETIDLSDHGVRIRLRGWTVRVGSMVVLRIPVLEAGITVPTLAQVRWFEEVMPGVLHVGLSFML